MTVKQEVLQILADAPEPLTSLAIFQKCTEASGRPIVSQTLSLLKAEEWVVPDGMSEVEGEHSMVLWKITAEGRTELRDIGRAQENTAGGGCAQGTRQKAQGKSRAAAQGEEGRA